MKTIKRFVRSIINAFITLIVKTRCWRLGIKYAKGFYVGKHVQNWGKTTIIVSRFSRIASGCIFWGGGKVVIGENTHIGENSWLYANPNGGITIGNDVNMAANVYIIDSDHGIKRDCLIRLQPMITKEITIGNDVWIGTNVTILRGSSIADGCVIGACSLVKCSTSPYCVYGGVPCKFIKER